MYSSQRKAREARLSRGLRETRRRDMEDRRQRDHHYAHKRLSMRAQRTRDNLHVVACLLAVPACATVFAGMAICLCAMSPAIGADTVFWKQRRKYHVAGPFVLAGGCLLTLLTYALYKWTRTGPQRLAMTSGGGWSGSQEVSDITTKSPERISSPLDSSSPSCGGIIAGSAEPTELDTFVDVTMTERQFRHTPHHSPHRYIRPHHLQLADTTHGARVITGGASTSDQGSCDVMTHDGYISPYGSQSCSSQRRLVQSETSQAGNHNHVEWRPYKKLHPAEVVDGLPALRCMEDGSRMVTYEMAVQRDPPVGDARRDPAGSYRPAAMHYDPRDGGTVRITKEASLNIHKDQQRFTGARSSYKVNPGTDAPSTFGPPPSLDTSSDSVVCDEIKALARQRGPPPLPCPPPCRSTSQPPGGASMRNSWTDSAPTSVVGSQDQPLARYAMHDRQVLDTTKTETTAPISEASSSSSSSVSSAAVAAKVRASGDKFIYPLPDSLVDAADRSNTSLHLERLSEMLDRVLGGALGLLEAKDQQDFLGGALCGEELDEGVRCSDSGDEGADVGVAGLGRARGGVRSSASCPSVTELAMGGLVGGAVHVGRAGASIDVLSPSYAESSSHDELLSAVPAPRSTHTALLNGSAPGPTPPALTPRYLGDTQRRLAVGTTSPNQLRITDCTGEKGGRFRPRLMKSPRVSQNLFEPELYSGGQHASDIAVLLDSNYCTDTAEVAGSRGDEHADNVGVSEHGNPRPSGSNLNKLDVPPPSPTPQRRMIQRQARVSSSKVTTV